LVKVGKWDIAGDAYQGGMEITIIGYFCNGDGLPSNGIRFFGESCCVLAKKSVTVK
jgi:hypothetical protein